MTPGGSVLAKPSILLIGVKLKPYMTTVINTKPNVTGVI